MLSMPVVGRQRLQVRVGRIHDGVPARVLQRNAAFDRGILEEGVELLCRHAAGVVEVAQQRGGGRDDDGGEGEEEQAQEVEEEAEPWQAQRHGCWWVSATDRWSVDLCR